MTPRSANRGSLPASASAARRAQFARARQHLHLPRGLPADRFGASQRRDLHPLCRRPCLLRRRQLRPLRAPFLHARRRHPYGRRLLRESPQDAHHASRSAATLGRSGVNQHLNVKRADFDAESDAHELHPPRSGKPESRGSPHLSAHLEGRVTLCNGQSREGPTASRDI